MLFPFKLFQIDDDHRDVGRCDTGDTGGLTDIVGAEGFEFLPGFETKAFDIIVIDGVGYPLAFYFLELLHLPLLAFNVAGVFDLDVDLLTDAVGEDGALRIQRGQHSVIQLRTADQFLHRHAGDQRCAAVSGQKNLSRFVGADDDAGNAGDLFIDDVSVTDEELGGK